MGFAIAAVLFGVLAAINTWRLTNEQEKRQRLDRIFQGEIEKNLALMRENHELHTALENIRNSATHRN